MNSGTDSRSSTAFVRALAWPVARFAYPGVVAASVGLAAWLLGRGAPAGVVTTVVFFAALAMTTALERAWPHRREWSASSSELPQDAFYLALAAAGQSLAKVGGRVFAGLVTLALVSAVGVHAWPSRWPLWLRAALAFAVSDLGKYWLHRVAHERPWLWRFHAEHHAPTKMYGLNTVRLHPVNALWNFLLEIVPALLLGLDADAVVVLTAFRAAVSLLQHANVELELGPLDWIFSTPVLHQWHHSTELAEANSNYGSTLIVWDVLFGTRRRPQRRAAPDSLGLADGAKHPARVWAQLVLPWSQKRVRAFAVSFVALLVLAAAALVFVVPGAIEAQLNRTAPSVARAPSPRATSLHARLTVVDLHADSLLWGRDLLARSARGHVDVPRLVAGNVAIQEFSIVTKTPRHQNIDSNADDSDNIAWLALAQGWPPETWTDLTERALYQARRLDDTARRSGGKLTVLHTRAELDAYLERRARDPSLTAGFLGVEGAQALGGELANLDRLFSAGVRMMALTHFSDNELGGSASGERKTGLTAMGRALVARMEERRMIVDLAHASPETLDEVLALATRPVLVSHTGVRGTCDNARNLGDEQLRRIAANGGVVGIGYWGHAVCTVDAPSIARAIRHAISVMGVEHVALGSDFDGTTTTPFDTASLSELTDALMEEGFADGEIAAVMGENALRMLRVLLPP